MTQMPFIFMLGPLHAVSTHPWRKITPPCPQTAHLACSTPNPGFGVLQQVQEEDHQEEERQELEQRLEKYINYRELILLVLRPISLLYMC
jgi:hypothetical protein